MMSESTNILLILVVVNVFMVLVTATNPIVRMDKPKDEKLEELLADDYLLELKKNHRGRSSPTNATTTASPSLRHAMVMPFPHFEKPELEILFEEDEYILPSNEDLRHHRRKRQVISEGSGNSNDGVETRVVLDEPFRFSASEITALENAARTMVIGFYTSQGVGQSDLTVTASDNGQQSTLLTFTTLFEAVDNRVLVAHVFKKYIIGKTISTYHQKSDPTVINAAGVEISVTCFLCPADRPCTNGATTCGAFPTVTSADLFPWGYSTSDDRLPHDIDSISGPIEIGMDFVFNGAAQKYVYVGDNGILTLSATSSSGVNPPDLQDIDISPDTIICVFCADVNIKYAGRSADVFYNRYYVREDRALPILERATNEVREVDPDFEAFAVIVVTWYDVPYYENADKTTPSTERNLFQAVLITDGEDSYVLFFYKDMQWPQSKQDTAVVGFKHLSTTALQNYKKVKEDGDQREQISFDALTGNTGLAGVFLLKVGHNALVSSQTEAKRACGHWYKANFPFIGDFNSDVEKMPRCPCSERHMSRHRRFNFFEESEGLKCYQLRRNRNKDDGLSCCYRDGTFASDSPRSRYLRFRRGTGAHDASDVTSLENCCQTSNSLCSVFRRARPITTCSASSRVRSSRAHGDPHIMTLDGVTYTFNGLGEYMMFVLDNVAEGFKFTFQCRTSAAKKPDGTDSQATIFQAFAGKEEGSGETNGGNFFVEMNEDKTLLVIFANGEDLSPNFHLDASYNKEYANIAVTRMGDNNVAFTFSDSDITITVTLVLQTLSVDVSIPTRHEGMSQGLMGNFDGDGTNDLKKATGEALLSTASDRDIFAMGNTWRVTSDTSIMRYEGSTWQSNNNLEFQPVFFDEIAAQTKQDSLTVCKTLDNKQCILDFVATGNPALAEATTNTQTTAVDTREIQENSAPSLTGTESINVKKGESVSLTYQSIDNEGDAVTYVVSNQPSGFTINQGTGSASWTPPDASPVSILVNAQDAKGLASKQINVRIVLCDDCVNGVCDYTTTRDSPSADAPDTFKLATCTCNTGWGDTDCNTDLDGCATQPCGTQRTCQDVTPAVQVSSGKAFNCGPCPDGYTVSATDPAKCDDVNECDGAHGCPANSQCENTIGSFLCNCNVGFRKQGQLCADIDECAERTNDCKQVCENTDGTYTCSCLAGFTLDADQKSCSQAVVPPSCTSFSCSELCAEVDGSPKCFCNPGYNLNNDQKTCVDTNECELGVCAQSCSNSPGSFTCSCLDGFQLAADQRSCQPCATPKWGPNCGNTCACNGRASVCDSVKGCLCEAGWTDTNCVTDVNECQVNPGICGTKQTCQNINGGYRCNCPNGYIKSGTDCIDINECTATTNPCPENSQCQNTEGSFSCNCNLGFIKVGIVCQDINECSNGQTACEQICDNMPGSYNCRCYDGYILNDDRRSCREFGNDPCGPNECLHACVLGGEAPGTPTCKCNKGYTLAADNLGCDDIDECADAALNTCTDKSSCRNTAGRFECSCSAGTKLENDERTCAACDDNHWGLNCANECACSSLGSSSCDKVTGCVCTNGWTGDKCDTDVNECNTVDCQDNSDCENLPGSYRCQCRTGYTASGNTCVDINECEGTNECDHDCANTVGSYTCTCKEGFLLEGKGKCKDIDECSLGTSGCSQICRNTLGGSACECYEGYNVDLTDPKKCIQGAGAVCNSRTDCTQNCRTTSSGSEDCFCNSGYTLNADGKTCDDILECSLDPPRCSQGCTESPGSFTCTCNPGFKLAADTTTCSSCESGKWGANCANDCLCDTSNSLSCNTVNGSCECRTGWQGATCTQDVLECTNNPNICGNKGVCNEKAGTYTCTCVAGFIRNNDACSPCDSKHWGANCAQICLCDVTQSTSCNAVNGTCTCKPEWTGATCTEDVNECDNPTTCSGNHEQCRNTPGSFECDCVDGYVKAPNNTCVPCNLGFYGAGCATQCNCVAGHFASCDNLDGSCTCKSGWNDTTCNNNINECANTASPVCTANLEVCRDTQGSYQCDCQPGYYKAPNDTCIVCDKGKYGNLCAQDCPCVANNFESCNNFNGSCQCNAGWDGDICDNNINECLQTSPSVCSTTISTCRDTNGSYVCDCKTGFTNSATGSCVDVNECAEGYPNNCVYVCNNIVGSFFCACPEGYSGTGNTCTAVFRTYTVVVTLNMDRTAIVSGSRTSQAWINLAALIAAEISKVVRPIFGVSHVPTVLTDMRAGSIVATADLRIDPTKTSEDADALAATGVGALAATPSLSVDGTAAPISSVNYNNVTIPTTDNACDILKLSKNLGSDEYCELNDNGIPVVRKLSKQDVNLPLIVGLTVPLALVVGVLLALIIFVCCCKKSKSGARTPSDEGRDNTAFRSAFVGNLPTKGNFGASRYMMYSPHTLSETASQASGENGYRYTRPKTMEGRSDFLDMPGPSERGYNNYTPRDNGFDENGRSNFSWENMFNMLEPSRNAPFEVPRPNVTNSPNRVYRNGKFHDSLA